MIIFKRSVIFLVLIFLVVTGHINAQTSLLIAYQVADIAPNATDMNSQPQVLHSAGNQIYFLADDNIHGQELWHTDGTPAGTAIVKDISPGISNSNINQFGIEANGLMFFVANDRLHGAELWKTDGSSEGTLLVKDINPHVSTRPFPDTYYEPQPGLLGSLNDTLLFVVDDGSHGKELWLSDGSSDGTVLLKDINSGPDGSDIKSPIHWSDHLYFIANDGIHGDELWRTDGTPGGTVLVKDINPGPASSESSPFSEGLGGFFFIAEDGTHGQELWHSNGTTSGTKLVKDIYPGTSPALDPYSLWDSAIILNHFYFVAADGVHGQELWRSDGTELGTELVKDINPGITSANPRRLTTSGNTLFFAANDGVDGQELWHSDGTNTGTVLVKDIIAGSASTDLWHLTAFANGLAFFVDDGIHGRELWYSDGSTANLVKDINPGSASAINSINQPGLAVVNNTLLFRADDDSHGPELWRSDGTAAGTSLMNDINSGLDGSTPGWFRVFDNYLYLRADDGLHGEELWRSDGTSAGTSLVKNINTYPYGSDPNSLTDVNERLFFSAETEAVGRELWSTDGTPGTTILVKDIYSGPESSRPDTFTAFDEMLFFVADDGLFGRELWRSDGTSEGTILVKDIVIGPDGSYPSNLMSLNETLFFTTPNGLWRSDGTTAGTTELAEGEFSDLTALNGILYLIHSTSFNNRELWLSDGTIPGTSKVTDIGSTFDIYNFLGDGNMRSAGNRLYFLVNAGTSGIELATSDGTAAGTRLVKDINPGSGDALVTWYQLRAATLDETIYFSADDGNHGFELWKSDGTEAGTVMVKDIVPDSVGSAPDDFVAWNNKVYFTAYTPGTGYELWQTDGTDGGTSMVLELNPGPYHGLIPYFEHGLFAADDGLYLRADDGIRGFELWHSDGTSAGTSLVRDIAPGLTYSLPLYFTKSGERLYFVANDATTGSELWAAFTGVLDKSVYLPIVAHN